MTERCFSSEELHGVLRLPPDSPERIHLEACPRCRILALTYREFLDDDSVPVQANLGDARTRLRAAFGREMAGPPRSSGWMRWLGREIGRASVLVPAAAAALLAIGLYEGYAHVRDHGASDPLRGEATSGRDAISVGIELLKPILRADGAVELRWRAVDGITFYEVVILGTDLGELVRLPAAPETTRVLRREELRPTPASGSVLGWQVRGLEDGIPVARSPIGAIRLP